MKASNDENPELSGENNCKDIGHLEDSTNDSNVSPDLNTDHSYEALDNNSKQKQLDKNKKSSSTSDLVKPRQNAKHRFAPYTKTQRRLRRSEVYRLHFEHGMPATRIAEMMKVDRNTINNDLKVLYQKALSDYNPDNMSFDEIIEKQLVRLETQRDRLGLYLCDVNDINSKISIERLIADVDFKLIGAIEKVNHNSNRVVNEIIKGVNKMAESNNIKLRYTSLFELHKISLDSRKSLDEIEDLVFKRKRNNLEDKIENS